MLGLLLCLLDSGPLDGGQLACNDLPSKHEAKWLAERITRAQLDLRRADFYCFSPMPLGPSLLGIHVPAGGWGLPPRDGCRMMGLHLLQPGK